MKTRKPTSAEQQVTKAVAELTSSMIARAATAALGISNPPTQQHGPGGVGSEGSGGSGATGLAGSVAGSGGSGEPQTKKEQEEEQREEQKRQSGHSGCSGGAAEGRARRQPSLLRGLPEAPLALLEAAALRRILLSLHCSRP